MAELLLELFSEEIPARMQDRAREDLARILGELLTESGIAFERPIRSFATPRRLAVVVDGLPLQQADRVIERKGPRADAPEQAKAGFLRGLAGLDYTLEEREEKKSRVVFAIVRERGRKVGELLAELVPQAVQRLPWPKSMRWGSGDFRWVRPLHGILCLFDGKVVPFAVGGIESGDTTRGHRFMAPEPFAVRDFADYVVKLREAKVMLDGAERRALIEKAAHELAAAEGYVVEDDPALLDEIKGLVEWPVPLEGSIDEAFMSVPSEVLVSTMRANQKYLALRTKEGALAPRFVVVANMLARDGGAAIVAGNERVLRARLWDARFFWEQDRKVPLESRLPALDKMVFHAELGSLGQRVERLVALAGVLVPHVPGADRLLAERAALLAKADLVTGMVGEFPELQGIMGAHYARVQNEPEAVVAAIRDHYAPKGPEDRCPTAPESVVVALADKLDTLVGFFGVGIRPTGSKDPFALRRAALGVIRLILENRLRLPLREAFAAARAGYGARLETVDGQALAQELMAFFADRLKVHLRERGVRHDLISAAFAVAEDDDLVRLLARVDALQSFLDTDDGRNLLTAYRRASSIVSIEEKKDGRRYVGHAVAGALVEPAEEALHATLEAARAAIDRSLAAEDFAGAMAALAALRGPVDRFFDQVMVNVAEPDLRTNRLLLLGQIRSALERVAGFSLIEDTGRAGG
ncbi:glycine--tRNA ligase subunit beta [Benzoatithermus flavus]|uniref:Glycine--tRNA ligase beta subunit n=1 Tax=Benzoatithermus flavus TaxID=3108223 RepID=A0ABU8XUF9_9PROT